MGTIAASAIVLSVSMLFALMSIWPLIGERQSVRPDRPVSRVTEGPAQVVTVPNSPRSPTLVRC